MSGSSSAASRSSTPPGPSAFSRRAIRPRTTSLSTRSPPVCSPSRVDRRSASGRGSRPTTTSNRAVAASSAAPGRTTVPVPASRTSATRSRSIRAAWTPASSTTSGRRADGRLLRRLDHVGRRRPVQGRLRHVGLVAVTEMRLYDLRVTVERIEGRRSTEPTGRCTSRCMRRPGAARTKNIPHSRARGKARGSNVVWEALSSRLDRHGTLHVVDIPDVSVRTRRWGRRPPTRPSARSADAGVFPSDLGSRDDLAESVARGWLNNPEVKVVVGAVSVVDEDGDWARDRAREAVEPYLCIARSPEEVAARVLELWDSGADRVELGTPQGRTPLAGVAPSASASYRCSSV